MIDKDTTFFQIQPLFDPKFRVLLLVSSINLSIVDQKLFLRGVREFICPCALSRWFVKDFYLHISVYCKMVKENLYELIKMGYSFLWIGGFTWLAMTIIKYLALKYQKLYRIQILKNDKWSCILKILRSFEKKQRFWWMSWWL